MISYKFLPTEESAIRCQHVIGKSKTFAIQVTDRRDRESRIYYHTMAFRTAGMILTDQVEVATTNLQGGEIMMHPDTVMLAGEGVEAFYMVRKK
jgi:hypothetical protein